MANISPVWIAAAAQGGGAAVTLEDRLIAAAGAGAFSIYTADNVTTNGSGRFRWTDLTGNGHHLDSPSVAADPSVVGGQVEFDGVGNYLQSVSAASVYRPFHDGTAVAVLWMLADLLGDGHLAGTTNNNLSPGFQLTVLGTVRVQGVVSNGSSAFAANADRVDAIEKSVLRWRHDGSNVDVRAVDDDEVGTGTAATSALSASDSPVPFEVGRRPNAGSYTAVRVRAVALALNPTAGQVSAVDAVLEDEL